VEDWTKRAEVSFSVGRELEFPMNLQSRGQNAPDEVLKAYAGEWRSRAGSRMSTARKMTSAAGGGAAGLGDGASERSKTALGSHREMMMTSAGPGSSRDAHRSSSANAMGQVALLSISLPLALQCASPLDTSAFSAWCIFRNVRSVMKCHQMTSTTRHRSREETCACRRTSTALEEKKASGYGSEYHLTSSSANLDT